jgi:thymidine kinase
MFSGKTEELIRRLNRAIIARKEVVIFKPELDQRYSSDHLVSHNQSKIPAIAVGNTKLILEMSKKHEVIGIDEAQFFDEGLLNVCEILAKEGKRVVIAGLDMDYLGKPFGIMPQLMAISDEVLKLHAVCMQCGEQAVFSKRLHHASDTVLLGAKENYEPRCRFCYFN